jgi:hypothetical protein
MTYIVVPNAAYEFLHLVLYVQYVIPFPYQLFFGNVKNGGGRWRAKMGAKKLSDPRLERLFVLGDPFRVRSCRRRKGCLFYTEGLKAVLGPPL